MSTLKKTQPQENAAKQKMKRMKRELAYLEDNIRRERLPFSGFNPSKNRPNPASCFCALEDSELRIRDKAFEELFRTCSRKEILDFAKEHYGLTPYECIFLWFRLGTRQGKKMPVVEIIAGYNPYFITFSKNISAAYFIKEKKMWSAIYDDTTKEQLCNHLFNMYKLIVDVNNRIIFSGTAELTFMPKQEIRFLGQPVPLKVKTILDALYEYTPGLTSSLKERTLRILDGNSFVHLIQNDFIACAELLYFRCSTVNGLPLYALFNVNTMNFQKIDIRKGHDIQTIIAKYITACEVSGKKPYYTTP